MAEEIEKAANEKARQKSDKSFIAVRMASGIKKFVLEVVAELKRVVYPTKAELIENSIVVLVFVTIMMAFITLIDFGIGQGVMALFTK
ncbi:MAG: preprotein translocase subunit SecE [Bifidobacteriaceae bacterium]|nr:preprotein translocase subunit SecE [Bifidobacteriaceae bacterium]